MDEIRDDTPQDDACAKGGSFEDEHAIEESRFARLKLACDASTDTALGIALGISQAAVAKAKKKGRVPSDWIVLISNKFGVSADWLLYGEGAIYDPERTTVEPARAGMLQAGKRVVEIKVTKPTPNAERIIKCDTSELIMVPMVEARLSAGTGSFQTGGDTERYYAFRLDFLRRKGFPSKMALMRVSGDSMEPEIKDGDVVLIDQAQQTPTPGKLYAVGVEDMVYIKEVNAEPGKLILSSYNKAYPALEVDARGDLKDGIRIVGRAVWIGRELK
ncbi:S24 family peptidase [Fundidesulfovibrio butyratiphilus]